MGLYNFQKRFVLPIRRREKTHTIRAVRKNPDKPGNTLYLYTGLRTSRAERIIPPVQCVKVETIYIDLAGRIWINDEKLQNDEKELLAKRDGFENLAEMLKFWKVPKNRLPFSGHIIHWREKINGR